MSQNKFTISYPALPSGTDKSEIEFIKGKPDLVALFFEGEEAKESRRRFFVTDATVASVIKKRLRFSSDSFPSKNKAAKSGVP